VLRDRGGIASFESDVDRTNSRCFHTIVFAQEVQVVPFGIDVARLNVRLIADVDEMLRSQRDPVALFRSKRVEQRCKRE
jgi:hypothetical protein